MQKEHELHDQVRQMQPFVLVVANGADFYLQNGRETWCDVKELFELIGSLAEVMDDDDGRQDDHYLKDYNNDHLAAAHGYQAQTLRLHLLLPGHVAK